ncbi:type II toxin-antitoxin system RelE/ParE family toxin [Luteitalea sp.]
MTAKPVVPRRVALRDIDEAVAYYLGEGGDETALRFIDAVEKAFTRIGRHPASGSPRYAVELTLRGLRAMPVTRHPHLVFYVDRDDHVDVWRVLHGERDIPAWISSRDNV